MSLTYNFRLQISTHMKKFLVLAAVAFITLTAAVVADIYSSLDINKEQAKKRLLEWNGSPFAGERNEEPASRVIRERKYRFVEDPPPLL